MQNINELIIYGYTLLIFSALLIAVIMWFLMNKKKTIKFKELPEIEQKFDKDGFANFFYNMLPRRQRLRNAEMDVVILDNRIRELEEELTNCKIKMAQSCARLNDLKAHEIDNVELDACTRNQIDNDFVRIKKIEGVQRICVNGGTLEVCVRVNYQYDNKIYDLGDYEVYISSMGLFNLVPIRDGNMRRYGLGVYLEEKNSDISECIKSGHIAEAIEIIIACLCRVGKRERAVILENCDIIAEIADEDDS